MSVEMKQHEVTRLQKKVSDLLKQDANEAKKEGSKAKEVERVSRSIKNAKGGNSAQNNIRRLNRLNDEIAKIQAKRAEYSKKIAYQRDKLSKAETTFNKEKEKAVKKNAEAEKRRELERIQQQKQLTEELNRQKTLSTQFNQIDESITDNQKQYDVFICHASEDKEEFVRPLAEALKSKGIGVWYDEFTMKMGDSLRRKIDHGISSARYGIVVLSESFFRKEWPQRELDGLTTKETTSGEKVILPIWHKVTKDEVMIYSPILADKVAINSSLVNISEIVDEISNVI